MLVLIALTSYNGSMAMSSILIDDTEYFTVAGAARELGCTVFAVKKGIERGQFVPARKLGNYNLFDREEVERYRREHLKPRKNRVAEKVSGCC